MTRLRIWQPLFRWIERVLRRARPDSLSVETDGQALGVEWFQREDLEPAMLFILTVVAPDFESTDSSMIRLVNRDTSESDLIVAEGRSANEFAKELDEKLEIALLDRVEFQILECGISFPASIDGDRNRGSLTIYLPGVRTSQVERAAGAVSQRTGREIHWPWGSQEKQDSQI